MASLKLARLSAASTSTDSTMKRLFLMRHAEAEHGSGSDHQRRLTAYGREQAANVGSWLRRQNWTVDAIIASDAKRTLETARLVHENLLTGAETAASVNPVSALYNAPMSAYFDYLAELDNSLDAVLIVGHNPAIGDLISRAAGRPVSVVTGTIADIVVPAWSDLADRGETSAVYTHDGRNLLDIM